MTLALTHMVLLSLAIGLSWIGCAKIFSSKADHRELLSPGPTIAATVNLSAIGLCFAQCSPGPAMVTVILGVALAASTTRTLNPVFGLTVSTASLTLCLHLSPL
jgi:hypothetical protein